jgi:hypothetical protein
MRFINFILFFVLLFTSCFKPDYFWENGLSNFDIPRGSKFDLVPIPNRSRPSLWIPLRVDSLKGESRGRLISPTYLKIHVKSRLWSKLWSWSLVRITFGESLDLSLTPIYGRLLRLGVNQIVDVGW